MINECQKKLLDRLDQRNAMVEGVKDAVAFVMFSAALIAIYVVARAM